MQAQQDMSFDLANFDNSISPADNFFNYTNGGWQAANPIPPEYPNWNTFLELHTQNQTRIKALLAELSTTDGDGESKTQPLQGEARKVSIFYKAGLDEAAIEKFGHVEPLAPLMAQCEAAGVKENRARCLGEFSKKFGLGFFFGVGASPDNKNSDHCIAQLGQSGLGLPDRDYYFDEDKAEKRTAYQKHIANMLTLLDPTVYTETVATETSALIYGIELDIAGSHMTKTEKRDPLATYNKMDVAALTELCNGSFDFATFLTAMGKESVDAIGDINVRNVKAIQKIAQVLSGLDATTMVHYLKWHTISKVASYLPKVFVDEDFHFYQTVLSGTKELKPRWKRAMAMTETALGEALGKMYCNKYFDEDCKNRAFAIVESVRAALEERLKEVPWMTADATREAALKKMKNFKIKIGKNRTSIKVRSGDECMVVYFCPFVGLTSLGFDERTLKMTNFFFVGCSPNFFQGTPTHGSITRP